MLTETVSSGFILNVLSNFKKFNDTVFCLFYWKEMVGIGKNYCPLIIPINALD